jgi:hypothetical protein
VTKTDGTVTVNFRIPLAGGADPASIDYLKATLTGLTPSGLSYGYVNAGGTLVPITAKSARSATVTPPYLQISFTAPSLAEVKRGALEKVAYWKRGDATEYVQTFTTPLALSETTFTDETPTPEKPDDPNPAENFGGSGGGCDAGAGIFALCLLALASVVGRKRSEIA